MPKEVIGRSNPHDAYAVAVGWSDHTVQLSVETNAPSLVEAMYLGSPQDSSGMVTAYSTVGVAVRDRMKVYAEGSASGEVNDYYAGKAAIEGLTDVSAFRAVFADLGREQINDLIRHLRRARDGAYGRDE